MIAKHKISLGFMVVSPDFREGVREKDGVAALRSEVRE